MYDHDDDTGDGEDAGNGADSNFDDVKTVVGSVMHAVSCLGLMYDE